MALYLIILSPESPVIYDFAYKVVTAIEKLIKLTHQQMTAQCRNPATTKQYILYYFCSACKSYNFSSKFIFCLF